MHVQPEIATAPARSPTLSGRRFLHPGVLLILAVFLFLGMLLATIPDEEVLSVAVYLPVVVLLANIVYHKGMKPADPSEQPALYWLAFVLKLASTLAYYWLILEVYGRGDANRYHKEAEVVSQYLSRFDFAFVRAYSFGRQGSTNIIYLLSALYSVLPVSRLGGGFIFATLSFTGSVLYYRAYRLAFPESEGHFYRLVVFFLPSILFWTSAVGKDAWSFFASGFVAYGLALYARQARPVGLAVAAVGLGLTYLARPHLAAFMILAAGVAFLLFYRLASRQRLLVWLLGMVTIVVGGVFVLQSAGEFLGLGSVFTLSAQELEEFYDFRQDVSTTGGSEFTPQTAFTLFGLLAAPVTVLFRPFPWEVHNLWATLTSLESLAWLGLFLWRRRVLWQRLLSIRQDPWVAFALGYSAIMIVALTTVGNFGIVARQRVALLPFLWLLFA
jgi:hypothetical protein